MDLPLVAKQTDQSDAKSEYNILLDQRLTNEYAIDSDNLQDAILSSENTEVDSKSSNYIEDEFFSETLEYLTQSDHENTNLSIISDYTTYNSNFDFFKQVIRFIITFLLVHVVYCFLTKILTVFTIC